MPWALTRKRRRRRRRRRRGIQFEAGLRNLVLLPTTHSSFFTDQFWQNYVVCPSGLEAMHQ
jgi:hypothetical protein